MLKCQRLLNIDARISAIVQDADHCIREFYRYALRLAILSWINQIWIKPHAVFLQRLGKLRVNERDDFREYLELQM